MTEKKVEVSDEYLTAFVVGYSFKPGRMRVNPVLVPSGLNLITDIPPGCIVHPSGEVTLAPAGVAKVREKLEKRETPTLFSFDGPTDHE